MGLAVSSTVTGLGFWHIAPAALAKDGLVAAAATITFPAVGGEESAYTYVGSKKCKKCHLKQYRSWAETRMAKAFHILEPGNNKEAKEKFKLDVDKNYTLDKSEPCLKCHTVGYGKPGGYAIPDPTDKKAVRRAKKLEGVGCECCHGPGSAYVKVFDEILKSKRKYKVQELYDVGLIKISEVVCTACHNEESPSVNPGDIFDYEKRKDDGIHEHFPLKQRVP